MTAPDVVPEHNDLSHGVRSGSWCVVCEQVAGSSCSLDRLCELMHDAYEAEATRAGWATQPSSRVRWRDVPQANKAAMRAGVSALLSAGLITVETVERIFDAWVDDLVRNHGDRTVAAVLSSPAIQSLFTGDIGQSAGAE